MKPVLKSLSGKIVAPSSSYLVSVALAVVSTWCGCTPSIEESRQVASRSEMPRDTTSANPQQEAGSSSPASALIEQIDNALANATRFLVEHQSPDGAWRSDTYAAFRQGDALSPLVLLALTALPTENQPNETIARGRKFLSSRVDATGNIILPNHGIAYPVYTAADNLRVIDKHDRSMATRLQQEAWLRYLRNHQLNKANGWNDTDQAYGGWGYDLEVPRKPAAGQPPNPLTEPNLSATVAALAGLQASGEAQVEERQAAASFVERCQNFAATETDTTWDDGGFYFIPTDEVRNKAGRSGVDPSGRVRFASYGSATVDGLRAMQLVGIPPEAPRMRAAWNWLAKNFSADQHPGIYSPEREAERNAVYFYYCNRLAELLAAEESEQIAWDREAWAQQLAVALLARQHADGSWKNPEPEVREDDPMVATAFAVRALAHCRRLLATDAK